MTSLVVQWLRLHVRNAGGLGSTPAQRTRSHKKSHAATEEPTGCDKRCHVLRPGTTKYIFFKMNILLMRSFTFSFHTLSLNSGEDYI